MHDCLFWLITGAAATAAAPLRFTPEPLEGELLLHVGSNKLVTNMMVLKCVRINPIFRILLFS
jgi:hypothetical protein